MDKIANLSSYYVSVAHNGQSCIIVGGSIIIYNFRSECIINKITSIRYPHYACFSSTDEHFAIKNSDGRIFLFDDNKKVNAFTPSKKQGSNIVFAPDNKILSGDWDGDLHVINLQTGSVNTILSLDGCMITSIYHNKHLKVYMVSVKRKSSAESYLYMIDDLTLTPVSKTIFHETMSVNYAIYNQVFSKYAILKGLDNLFDFMDESFNHMNYELQYQIRDARTHKAIIGRSFANCKEIDYSKYNLHERMADIDWTKDGKVLFVTYQNLLKLGKESLIIAIDANTSNVISTIEFDGLYSCKLAQDDRILVIGTMNGCYMSNIDELLG